jgi:aminobenzoyl-glutamate utilization protein B
MSQLFKRRSYSLLCVFVFLLVVCSSGLAKEKVSKEKKLVLDWLNQPEIVEKFGKISDVIWEYAELGMQEFKSSKLLADTLEEAGWVESTGFWIKS